MSINEKFQGFDLIQAEIDKVESLLRDLAGVSPEPLWVAVRDMINAGGKRLRPALVIACSYFGAKKDQRQDQILQAAAAIEIIHLATLIHDDIIDDSPVRRGVPALQERFGKEIAVFAGDYLLSQALSMLVPCLPPELLDRVSDSLKSLCLGEIEQFAHRYDLDISVDEHLGIIRKKTASLFSLACSTGASISEAPPPVVNSLQVYGTHLGMLFQLIDDILDLYGSKTKIGKPTGRDLEEGIYTLPIIYSLGVGGFRARLEPHLRPGVGAQDERPSCDAGTVAAIVREAGGLDHARAVAGQMAALAREALSGLPDVPQKYLLADLIDFVQDRGY
ncbi:MAG TPA: polyprenyl synthetase family protein [Firmicutes bacterium]|nr:polyprenyl synthetase family protein [Bacillota bacterium]